MSIRGHGSPAVLVEQAVEIEREMYLAISSSRAQRGPVLDLLAREGGVDIEEVARRDPGALVRTPVDPLLGLCDYQVRDVRRRRRARAGGRARRTARPPRQAAGRASCARSGASTATRDATLVEINPLVLTRQGELVCLDSKVTIDDNALYRQRRPGGAPTPEDEREAQGPPGRARVRRRSTATSACSATAPAS